MLIFFFSMRIVVYVNIFNSIIKISYFMIFEVSQIDKNISIYDCVVNFSFFYIFFIYYRYSDIVSIF